MIIVPCETHDGVWLYICILVVDVIYKLGLRFGVIYGRSRVHVLGNLRDSLMSSMG